MAKAFSRSTKKNSRFRERKKRTKYANADAYHWHRRIARSMAGSAKVRTAWINDMEATLNRK